MSDSKNRKIGEVCMKTKNMKKAVLYGCLAAIVVFTFGFGVMFLLWLHIGTTNDLPGLFDFRAAAVGDSLCLPVLVGGMVTFLFISQNVNRHQKIKVYCTCLIAAFIGGSVQMKWLLSENTELNWSIPIQHYFNAAGWYHSLFFIAMIGIIAGLFLAVLFTLKNKKDKISFGEGISLGGALCAGNLFLLLHISDDYKEIPVVVSFSSTTIVVLVVLLIVVRVLTKYIKEIFEYIIEGMVIAYIVALIICLKPIGGNILLGVAGAMAACAIYRVSKESLLKLIMHDIVTIIVIGGAFQIISLIESKWFMLIMYMILIILAILWEKFVNGEIRYHFLPIASIAAYAYLSNVSSELQIMEKALAFVFSCCLSLLMRKEIANSFQYVIDEEIRQNKGEQSNVKVAKAKEYLQISLSALSLLFIMIYWAKNIVNDYMQTVERGTLYIGFRSGIVFFVSVAVLWGVGGQHLRKYVVSKWIALLAIIGAYTSLLINYYNNVHDIFTIDISMASVATLIFGIFAAIGAPLLVADGLYRNIAGLFFEEKKKNIIFFAVVHGVFCLTENIFIMFGQIVDVSWSTIAAAILNIVIAYILLPTLSARVLQFDIPQLHVISSNELGGVAQDGFLISLIVIFIICIPSSFMGLLQSNDATLFLSLVTVLSPAFVPLVFCLENNVGHIRRQKEVLDRYPKEEREWIRLKKCLRRQNMLTMFALIPYIVICFGLEASKYILKDGTTKEAFKGIKEKFLGER